MRSGLLHGSLQECRDAPAIVFHDLNGVEFAAADDELGGAFLRASTGTTPKPERVRVFRAHGETAEPE